MADYRKAFQEAILAQNNQIDPTQKKLEDQIMAPSQGASMAPTISLIDNLTGSNLSSALPKEESMKEKLGQLLQMKQAQQAQKLSGLGKLAEMQNTSEQNAMERAFKEKMYGLQMMNARAKLAKNSGPNGGKSLSGEEKKAVGLSGAVLDGIRQLRESIKGGGSIAPDMWANNIHDNPTNAIRRLITENLGRLQSGGAISSDEEKRFGGLIGSWTDSPEMVLNKLQQLESDMNNKRELYGIGPNNSQRAPSGGGSATSNNYNDMSDAELAAMLEMGG